LLRFSYVSFKNKTETRSKFKKVGIRKRRKVRILHYSHFTFISILKQMISGKKKYWNIIISQPTLPLFAWKFIKLQEQQRITNKRYKNMWNKEIMQVLVLFECTKYGSGANLERKYTWVWVFVLSKLNTLFSNKLQRRLCHKCSIEPIQKVYNNFNTPSNLFF